VSASSTTSEPCFKSDLRKRNTVEPAFLETVEPTHQLRIVKRLGPFGRCPFDCGSRPERLRSSASSGRAFCVGCDRRRATALQWQHGRPPTWTIVSAPTRSMRRARKFPTSKTGPVQTDFCTRRIGDDLAAGPEYANSLDAEQRRSGLVVVHSGAADLDAMPGARAGAPAQPQPRDWRCRTGKTPDEQNVSDTKRYNSKGNNLRPRNGAVTRAEKSLTDTRDYGADPAGRLRWAMMHGTTVPGMRRVGVGMMSPARTMGMFRTHRNLCLSRPLALPMLQPALQRINARNAAPAPREPLNNATFSMYKGY
jgi:hypothetical protein